MQDGVPVPEVRRRRASLSGMLIVVAVLLAVGSVLVGCGDGSEEGTQPRPDGAEFGDGRLDDIPLVPGSEVASSVTERDDVVTQSYFTGSRAPEQVLEFYADTLDGEWQLVDEPSQLGADQTWRGRWARGAEVLVVSATDAETLQAQDDDAVTDVTTQYSLSLGPDQADR